MAAVSPGSSYSRFWRDDALEEERGRKKAERENVKLGNGSGCHSSQ